MTKTPLLGLETAEQKFLSAWFSGRMPHAWMISGPQGIGKAGLAKRMAAFVLAQGHDSQALFATSRPLSLDLPPDNQAALLVAEDAHPDYRLVQCAVDEKRKPPRLRTEIIAEQIRALEGFLCLTPSYGGWRVAIIDSADEMNRTAANAFLKMLEEPPPSVLLLLIAHHPSRLLPTLRSRCRFLAVSPLSVEFVSEAIRARFPDLAPNMVAFAADMAEGSPGRAIAFLEKGGAELDQTIASFLEKMPSLDMAALHQFAEQMAKDPSLFQHCAEILHWRLGRLIRNLSQKQNADLEVWLAVWDKMADLFERCEAIHLERKQVLINSMQMIARVFRA